MLRSLEFQVGALFELMDAHTARDVADRSVTEVIYRKRDGVVDTFDAVKEALWMQQERQFQTNNARHPNESEAPTTLSAIHADPAAQVAFPGNGCGSGLRELEELQACLAERVAAVGDREVSGNVAQIPTPIGRTSATQHAGVHSEYPLSAGVPLLQHPDIQSAVQGPTTMAFNPTSWPFTDLRPDLSTSSLLASFAPGSHGAMLGAFGPGQPGGGSEPGTIPAVPAPGAVPVQNFAAPPQFVSSDSCIPSASLPPLTLTETTFHFRSTN